MYKIVSFNLRYDTPNDGAQQFCHRLPFILDTIRAEAPDIIGFQECLQHMREALRDNLNDYYIVGGGRDADRFGESSVIAFRKNRFNLNECDTFWLSPTIYTPGSRYPEDQSPCPRVCTMVSLTDTGDGKSFLVYNLHTDHEGVKARIHSSELVLKRLKEDGERLGLPFLFTGDFNATPDAEEIQKLTKEGLRDLAAELGGTFHDYGRREESLKIDYIFASAGISAESVCLWDQTRDGLYLSDHYPVAALVNIP